MTPTFDKRGRVLTLTSCLLLLTTFARAFNTHQPFDITADVLEYVDSTQEMTAEGHAVVVQSSSTLSADLIRYDRARKSLIARGHVVFRENSNVMVGDQLDYDLVQEKGVVLGGMGYTSPWFFQGTTWEKHQDYYIGRQGSFTSCDLIDPHYHMRASRIHLIPDQFFWGWNNIFYLDTQPVFYSPFVYRFLGPRRVVFQAEPGVDGVKGDFAKTVTTVRWADRIYNRVFVDYYAKTGTGFGTEFNYQRPNYKGSLFGYYIDPRFNPDQPNAATTQQYNMRFYHWQSLSPYMTLQSNVNHRNNVSFNNEFFPEDYNQSVSDMTNSVALTHQKGGLNQRLVMESASGIDPGADPLYGTIYIQSAFLPRYEATYFQRPIWSPHVSSTTVRSMAHLNRMGPLLVSANGSAEEFYSRIDRTTRSRINGSFALTQSYVLSRQWSFNPGVNASIRWQDKYDPFTRPVGSTTTIIPVGIFRGYQGRVGTSNTLRYRPLSAITLDQTHSWTGRLAANTATLDKSLADGGVETHQLTWSLYWRPTRTVQFRSVSGYDLRVLADEDPNSYRQRRIQPWISEFTLHPRGSYWEYFFREQIGYYPTETQAWQIELRGQMPHRTLVQTGIFYNRSLPGILTWNNQLGFYLSPSWRVDTAFNALVPSQTYGQVRHGVLTQSEIIVTRDMHCWQAQFTYRDRPPFSREYGITFNLKLGVTAAKEIANKDLEAQFYPWRGRR